MPHCKQHLLILIDYEFIQLKYLCDKFNNALLKTSLLTLHIMLPDSVHLSVPQHPPCLLYPPHESKMKQSKQASKSKNKKVIKEKPIKPKQNKKPLPKQQNLYFSSSPAPPSPLHPS